MSALDALVRPLDGVRRVALRATVRLPGGVRLVAARDARIAAILTLHALGAFLLSLHAPVLLVVVGPVLLGVPHVVSGVRHLVLRRGLAPGFRRWLLLGAVAHVALRVAHELGLRAGSRVEWVISTVWVVGGAALGGLGARGAATVGVALALGAAAVRSPAVALGAFALAHNAVGAVLWLWWFRRRSAPIAVPLALTVGLAALLGSGALHGVTLASPAVELFGVHALDASDWLFPGLDADAAIGLVTVYAFAQSVHYAVWLVYVPADDSRAEAPRSFRASLRALRAELGSPGLAAVAVLAVVAVALGLASPVATRHVVLSVLGFHTVLELVVVAHALAGRSKGAARP